MALLSDEQVSEQLAGVPAWERAGTEITTERRLEDFAAALAFVDDVGRLAEAANHHPDILLHSWNKVRLTLSTHSEGGLTQADFALAKQVEALS